MSLIPTTKNKQPNTTVMPGHNGYMVHGPPYQYYTETVIIMG